MNLPRVSVRTVATRLWSLAGHGSDELLGVHLALPGLLLDHHGGRRRVTLRRGGVQYDCVESGSYLFA